MTPSHFERARQLVALARDTNRPDKVRIAAVKELKKLMAAHAAPPVPPATPAKPRPPAPAIEHKPVAQVAQVNVPAKTQEPVASWWIKATTCLLQSAAERGDHARVAELVAEFQAKGVPVPDYHGKPRDPEPEPEEPTYRNIDLPDDSRGRALTARRTRPVRQGPISWDEWRDTW